MMVRKEYIFLYALVGALAKVAYSLLKQRRAPPDEYGLLDNKTIFSRKFKNWNASLREAKIIPDVLLVEVPQPLTVVYFEDNLEFGTFLEHHRIDLQPIDLDWIPKESEFYTVIMSDPDFPDPKKPVQKEYLHWMITNVKDAFIKDGKMIAPYVPPTNKRLVTGNSTCKGFHRIVFVVYKQLKGKLRVSPDRYTSPEDHDNVDVKPHNREKFSSIDFAKDQNLAPIAANYFIMNMDIVEEEDVGWNVIEA